MTGEISSAWIRIFDEETKVKAAGRDRLLIVDGHTSHYTRTLLDDAKKRQIHIISYPSHSTHLFQGLDVICFSVLKHYWSLARDDYERKKRQPVGKDNFIEVYTPAHVAAFTKSNIKAAFRKTGLVPFNPGAIPDNLLAPSLETSSTADCLPLPADVPTKAAASFVKAYRKRMHRLQHSSDGDGEDTDTEDVFETPMQTFETSLQNSSASFLVTNEPIRSDQELPPLPTVLIPPSQHPSHSKYRLLLEGENVTMRESLLTDALRDREQYIGWVKGVMSGQQGATVIRDIYAQNIRAQLEAHEAKQSRKKSTRLNADGMPKLLTGSAFHQAVIDADDRKKAAEQSKHERGLAKQAFKKAKDAWESAEMDRKNRNKAAHDQWAKDSASWEAERDQAKKECRKPRWNKPKKPKAETGTSGNRPRWKDFEEQGKGVQNEKSALRADGIDENESSRESLSADSSEDPDFM